ncbi:MAG: PIN domain-containing protein [Terriglobales bacterium]
MKPPRCLVDTNVVVRHLVQDHPAHSQAATRLFEECDAGKLTVVFVEPVIAECVFVLESFYRHPRPAIAAALDQLLAVPGITVAPVRDLPAAFSRYAGSGLHFVDCLLVAAAAAAQLPVATFDAELRAASRPITWDWKSLRPSRE